ncbi:MAG: hypothetical protein ACTSPO_13145, partial [Candidatus Heimdallarchaeaceae archaeon]
FTGEWDTRITYREFKTLLKKHQVPTASIEKLKKLLFDDLGRINQLQVNYIDSSTWEVLGRDTELDEFSVNSYVNTNDLALYLRAGSSFNKNKQKVDITFINRSVNLLLTADPLKYQAVEEPSIKSFQEIYASIRTQYDKLKKEGRYVKEIYSKLEKDGISAHHLNFSYIAPEMLVKLEEMGKKYLWKNDKTGEIFINLTRYYGYLFDKVDNQKRRYVDFIVSGNQKSLADVRVGLSRVKLDLFDFLIYGKINSYSFPEKKLKQIEAKSVYSEEGALSNSLVAPLLMSIVDNTEEKEKIITEDYILRACTSDLKGIDIKAFQLLNGKIPKRSFGPFTVSPSGLYNLVPGRFSGIINIKVGNQQTRASLEQIFLTHYKKAEEKNISKQKNLKNKDFSSLFKTEYDKYVFHKKRPSQVITKHLKKIRLFQKNRNETEKNAKKYEQNLEMYGKQITAFYLARTKNSFTVKKDDQKLIFSKDIIILLAYVNGWIRTTKGGNEYTPALLSFARRTKHPSDVKVLGFNVNLLLDLIKRKYYGELTLQEKNLISTRFMQMIIGGIDILMHKSGKINRKSVWKSSRVFYDTGTIVAKLKQSERNERIYVKNEFINGINKSEWKEFVSKYLDYLDSIKNSQFLSTICFSFNVNSKGVNEVLNYLNIKKGEEKLIYKPEEISKIWRDLLVLMKESNITFHTESSPRFQFRIGGRKKGVIHSINAEEIFDKYSEMNNSVIFSDNQHERLVPPFKRYTYLFFDEELKDYKTLEDILLNGIEMKKETRERKVYKSFVEVVEQGGFVKSDEID